MLILFMISQIIVAIFAPVGPGAAPGLLALRGALAIPLFMGLLWLVQTKLDKRPWGEIGLQVKSRWLKQFEVGAGGGLVLFLFITGVLYAVGALEIADLLHHSKGWGYMPGLLAGGALFTLSIGLTEEALFRGYLIPYYSRYFGNGPALIISSLVFSFVHLMNPEYWITSVVIEVALIGLLLALIWQYHGSLWGAVGFHAAWDMAQFTLIGRQVDGRVPWESMVLMRNTGASWLTDPALFGVEGSAVEVGLVALVTVIYLYLVIRRRTGNRNAVV